MINDIHAIATAVETSFYDVARQARQLATALQNIAPGDKANTPNPTILYLSDMAERLYASAGTVKQILGGKDNLAQQLLVLVNEVMAYDKAQREQYQMIDKFRFIRDRIATLQGQLEESVGMLQAKEDKKIVSVSEDDISVYVYLFNAQGALFSTWQKMVRASLFYEYSINRPIYTEKAQIDGFIKRKENRLQHGYLTVIIKKAAVQQGEAPVDTMGNTLVKLKEGALLFDKLVSFTHDDKEYSVVETGELMLKPSAV